jgi:hypothetical protein
MSHSNSSGESGQLRVTYVAHYVTFLSIVAYQDLPRTLSGRVWLVVISCYQHLIKTQALAYIALRMTSAVFIPETLECMSFFIFASPVCIVLVI